MPVEDDMHGPVCIDRHVLDRGCLFRTTDRNGRGERGSPVIACNGEDLSPQAIGDHHQRILGCERLQGSAMQGLDRLHLVVAVRTRPRYQDVPVGPLVCDHQLRGGVGDMNGVSRRDRSVGTYRYLPGFEFTPLCCWQQHEAEAEQHSRRYESLAHTEPTCTHGLPPLYGKDNGNEMINVKKLYAVQTLPNESVTQSASN